MTEYSHLVETPSSKRRYFYDQDDLQKEWFELAFKTARKSPAKKQKCGAVLIQDNHVIATGFNHMPMGWEPSCEITENPTRATNNNPFCFKTLKSHPEVIHAEADAVSLAIHCGHSPVGGSIYITHAPCMNCAKSIYMSGIREVWIWNWAFSGITDSNLNKGGYDFLLEVLRRDSMFGTKSGLDLVKSFTATGVDTRTCNPWKL